MKKPILITSILAFSLMLAGCNSIQEHKAESIIKNYYQAIIDEDYEEAFEQLYLYDYDSENEYSKLSEGTTLSDKDAKDFYLKKTEVLNKQKYKIKNFEFVEVEYEDGHSFWHHIKLEVEKNGKKYEWNEVAHLYDGKLLIGEKNDPYVNYRDGKMNFDIEKEAEKDGI